MISHLYIQNMENININTSVNIYNDEYKKCQLLFYTYIFDDNIRLFGNDKIDISKYIKEANITITHVCSDYCRSGNNYNYKNNITIKCSNLKLNINNSDYNDILDMFSNIIIDNRSFECYKSCYHVMYITSALNDLSYLQTELIKYVGCTDIVNTQFETYTFINKSPVYFILHV